MVEGIYKSERGWSYKTKFSDPIIARFMAERQMGCFCMRLESSLPMKQSEGWSEHEALWGGQI
jgi:hypothetical protein